jgi:hypothetical protein
MAYKVSDHQARALRMAAQRLTGQDASALKSGNEVVKAVVGIQAQEIEPAYLSIYSRNLQGTAAGIEQEQLNAHLMVHSWFMRGTLHLVSTEDLDWLLPLLAPIFTFKRTSTEKHEPDAHTATKS